MNIADRSPFCAVGVLAGGVGEGNEALGSSIVVAAALALTLPPKTDLVKTLDGSVLSNAANAVARELDALVAGKRTDEETTVMPAVTVPSSSNPDST